MSVVQQVQKLTMSASMVSQQTQWQATKHRPSGPAQVYEQTAMQAQQACMIFAPARDANADGKEAA